MQSKIDIDNSSVIAQAFDEDAHACAGIDMVSLEQAGNELVQSMVNIDLSTHQFDIIGLAE